MDKNKTISDYLKILDSFIEAAKRDTIPATSSNVAKLNAKLTSVLNKSVPVPVVKPVVVPVVVPVVKPTVVPVSPVTPVTERPTIDVKNLFKIDNSIYEEAEENQWSYFKADPGFRPR